MNYSVKVTKIKKWWLPWKEWHHVEFLYKDRVMSEYVYDDFDTMCEALTIWYRKRDSGND